jgi:hypothetical protein
VKYLVLLMWPALAVAFVPASTSLPSATRTSLLTRPVMCRPAGLRGVSMMTDGADVAAAGFMLFNLAYVAQLLVKPRYDYGACMLLF